MPLPADDLDARSGEFDERALRLTRRVVESMELSTGHGCPIEAEAELYLGVLRRLDATSGKGSAQGQ